MAQFARRQGEAFAPAVGITARWVSYPHVFLYLPPPPDETLRMAGPEGVSCIGFNLFQLAEALAIDAARLLLSNQSRLLTVRLDPARATDGTQRTRYRFGILGAGAQAEFIEASV